MAAASALPAPSVCALIVGSGRSGTTFLAKLLDASPDVLYRHEPDAACATDAIPYIPSPAEIPRHRDAAAHYLAALAAQRDEKSAASRPMFPKRFRTAFGNRAVEAAAMLAKLAARLGLRLAVPDLVRKHGAPRLVIKSVNSLGRAPLFAAARPGLRILHIVRHPGGVVASLRQGDATGKMRANAYLASLFETAEPQHFPFTEAQIAARGWAVQQAYAWMLLNGKVHRELKDDPNYHLVCYETLCVATRATLAGIARAFDLPLDPQMLGFVAALEAQGDAERGYFDIVRNPMSALFKWRERLSVEDVEDVVKLVGMSEIGRIALASADAAERAGSAGPLNAAAT